MVKELLNAGFDIQAGRNAALLHAVLKGERRVVRVLLKSGADVHMDDNAPLKYATIKKDGKMIALLSQHITSLRRRVRTV